MNVPSRVAVVVLDWNGGEDTLACLDSLRACEAPEPRVILVDNASRESLADEARRRLPGIEIVRNERNLGYAGGNNVGLRLAREAGAEYILVLNNDAVVHPSTLRELVEAAASDSRIGAVGARILERDRPDRLWMAWGELTYRQSLVRLVGRGRLDGDAYAGRRDVEWVSGCAFLIRGDALDVVGAFDEDYFAYHEEVDWCARARESGFRVVYEPRAVVEHRGEGSSGGASYVSRKQYLAARNAVRFVRRHGSFGQKLRFTAWLCATLPLQYLRRLISAEQSGVILKMRGIRDGLLERDLPRDELGLD